MKPAANVMEEKIKNVSFKNPRFKIINNVTAYEETDASIIKKLLVDQIYSTVKWRESLIHMAKKGIKNFIEIGPGKALSGMVKRTIKIKIQIAFQLIQLLILKILMINLKIKKF